MEADHLEALLVALLEAIVVLLGRLAVLDSLAASLLPFWDNIISMQQTPKYIQRAEKML